MKTEKYRALVYPNFYKIMRGAKKRGIWWSDYWWEIGGDLWHPPGID